MKVKYLGDVHLGRVFKTGVPLHRRGEREAMVKQQFHAELTMTCDYLIQVGDLFDKHRVDLNDVVFAADTIVMVARNHPDRQYFFLAGNHDLSRDLEKISSFELVARLCEGLSNVWFVISYPICTPDGKIAMIPWSPTKTAAEMVGGLTGTYDCVVGHWDKVAFGDAPNLIPLEALSKITKKAVSGHDHVPDTYSYNNMQVNFVGSMQPYSFGEDPEEKFYINLSLQQAQNIKMDLTNMCIRVWLGHGEELPDDLDCLQLVGKRVGETTEEIEVSFEDGLNTLALFHESMKDILPEVAAAVIGKFEELRSA